jgi:hypothetical protein
LSRMLKPLEMPLYLAGLVWMLHLTTSAGGVVQPEGVLLRSDAQQGGCVQERV